MTSERICCGYVSTTVAMIVIGTLSMSVDATMIYEKTKTLIYRYTSMEAARGSIDEILRTKTIFFAVYCMDYVVALMTMCFDAVMIIGLYKHSRPFIRAYLIASVINSVLDVIMIPVLIAIKGIAVPHITGTLYGGFTLLFIYLYIHDDRFFKTAKKSDPVTVA